MGRASRNKWIRRARRTNLKFNGKYLPWQEIKKMWKQDKRWLRSSIKFGL